LPGRIDVLRAKVTGDQQSIRRLGVGITVQDLNDATKTAEEGRKEAILAAALSLVDGFLTAPEAALGTKSIAGYRLRNGLGSLGTGQANALIGKLEGGVKANLIPAIRKLSQLGDKTSTLEYLDALSRVASTLKATVELETARTSPDTASLKQAEALFGLAAAIAGKGELAVSLASAVINSAYNQTQIYLMAKSINQLTNTNESQLKALNLLSANLQQDTQNLQHAEKELHECTTQPDPPAKQTTGSRKAGEKLTCPPELAGQIADAEDRLATFCPLGPGEHSEYEVAASRSCTQDYQKILAGLRKSCK